MGSSATTFVLSFTLNKINSCPRWLVTLGCDGNEIGCIHKDMGQSSLSVTIGRGNEIQLFGGIDEGLHKGLVAPEVSRGDERRAHRAGHHWHSSKPSSRRIHKKQEQAALDHLTSKGTFIETILKIQTGQKDRIEKRTPLFNCNHSIIQLHRP